MNEIEELIKKIKWHLDETEGENSKGTFDQGYEHGCDYCICLLENLKRSLALEITEQQALNKLAERFPMTIDQIVSTLEMSQISVNHEPVEAPELVAKYLDYARQCLDLNVLTVCNYQNVKSNMGKIAADKIVHWAHKHPNEFIKAYQTGNYTVAKEPLYIVKVGELVFKSWEDSFIARMATTDSPGWESNVCRFESKNKANKVAKVIGGEVVPVEEEAE